MWVGFAFRRRCWSRSLANVTWRSEPSALIPYRSNVLNTSAGMKCSYDTGRPSSFAT